MTSEGPPAAVTDLPTSLPSLPRYGESTLADLACSVLASLGCRPEPNPLPLPNPARGSLLALAARAGELPPDHKPPTPSRPSRPGPGRPRTAGFPATTATSLASLGTGRAPGQHGVLGYQVAVPGEGRLLNALRWDQRVDPVAWQPGSTIFERAAKAGIAGFRVAHHALG